MQLIPSYEFQFNTFLSKVSGSKQPTVMRAFYCLSVYDLEYAT